MSARKDQNCAMIGNIRQNFAQCVFNHQAYEFAANREKCKRIFFRLLDLLLIAFSLFALVDHGQTIWLNTIGQYAIVIEIVLQFVQWSIGAENSPERYERTAREYLILREEYKTLLADLKDGNINNSDGQKRWCHITEKYSVVSKLAPQTTRRDYKKAQKHLMTNGSVSRQAEAYTWSDDEIDKFLPRELR